MNLAIRFSDEKIYPKALEIASQLGLAIDPLAKNYLYVSEETLSLHFEGYTPLSVDFTWQTWKKRVAEGKRQALIRACKVRPQMRVIDATAGWGRDAALLAGFGAQVLMLERNKLMALMIEDALMHRDEESKKKLQLSLLPGDACHYLKHLPSSEYPEVIFIDPMHPLRQKTALVKKEMQVLQKIIGCDTDAIALLQLARSRVKERVVVKWPQKQKPLLPADASIAGKTIRYDIYFPGKL